MRRRRIDGPDGCESPAATSTFTPRVLIIRQHFGSLDHSSSARGEQLARRLAASGVRVHVLAGSTQGEDRDLPPGLTIQRLGVRYDARMSFLRRKLSFAAFVLRCVPHVLRRRYDVVFASSTPLSVFGPALLAKAIRPSTRVVLEVRDLWPDIPVAVGALPKAWERSLAFWLERVSYDRVDHVIVLSPGMETVVASKSKTPRSVVTNGSSIAAMSDFTDDQVDALRDRLGIARDSPVVLYAGTLGLINDVDHLAALCRQIVEVSPRSTVLIVGDGPHAERFRSLVDGEPRIICADRVPRREVAQFFALADLSLVFFRDVPLMDTNSANKFFDSLAAGCPPVINYRGWQSDLLEEHGAGVVLVGDPYAAANEIAVVLADGARREQMSTSCRRLAEQFEWDRLYPEWERAVLGPMSPNDP